MVKKSDILVSALDIPRLFFGALAIFDWITPLVKEAQVFKHDPTMLKSWTFFVPYTRSIHKGWAKGNIKRLLEDNGISMYGDYVSFDELSFCVHISDAADAEDILNKYDIPIRRRSRGAPPPQRVHVPQPSTERSELELSRCAYCGSFDMRKGKCHNCGAIS